MYLRVQSPQKFVVPVSIHTQDEFADMAFSRNILLGAIDREWKRALRYAADVWKNTIARSEDLVARYGGEEFVAILPNTAFAAASVIELADVALYEDKSTGRNKVVSKRF